MVVRFRIRYLLTGALGLWLAHPAAADEPGKLSVKQSQVLAPTQEMSANQEVANTIADHLRQNGQLRHYNIHVVFQNGSAELTGSVTDSTGRSAADRPRRARRRAGSRQPVRRQRHQLGSRQSTARGAHCSSPRNGRIAGASADRPWSHGGPRCESAAPAALRLAHLRPIQQLLPRGVSEPVSIRGLAVHRTRLSIPQDSAWLAIGQADLGRRPLVV